MPVSYQLLQTPTNGPSGSVSNTCFGTDDVNVVLASGTTITDSYTAGPPSVANYTSKIYINGPVNWEDDPSLFKVFAMKNQMNLRLNFDVFNAFNHPGDPSPGAENSVEQKALSAPNTPRQLQVTARFTFQETC